MKIKNSYDIKKIQAHKTLFYQFKNITLMEFSNLNRHVNSVLRTLTNHV